MVLAGQVHQPQPLLRLLDHQQAGATGVIHGRLRLPLEPHGQGHAHLVDQPQGQRNHQRLLLGLPGGGRRVLADLQLQHARFPIPVALHLQHRRARLVIPAAELGEVKTGGGGTGSQGFGSLGFSRPGLGGGVLHRLHEVGAGGGRAIVAGHVERHAAHEGLLTQQGVEHANHLRALFVDRGGVEVINRLIGVRLHRMGRWASVFAKLRVAQQGHIFDAVESSTVQILREALVAEHREAFLQRQLEPVAAGDAVASPVVEVLVGDHTFNPLKFSVGGGFGVGQHQLGVEDIEALVLHGAHVEMTHRHDVVLIEVVLQAVALLIPCHRPLQ